MRGLFGYLGPRTVTAVLAPPPFKTQGRATLQPIGFPAESRLIVGVTSRTLER